MQLPVGAQPRGRGRIAKHLSDQPEAQRIRTGTQTVVEPRLQLRIAQSRVNVERLMARPKKNLVTQIGPGLCQLVALDGATQMAAHERGTGEVGHLLQQLGPGQGELTHPVVPAGMPGNVSDLNGTYAFNMDKAKALMAEAGYADGFELKMPIAQVFQTWQPSVEAAFKELKIKVTWDEMQMPDYQAKAATYPIFIAFISMDSNPVATVQRQISTPQWYNPTPGLDKFPEVKAQVDAVENAAPDAQLAEIEKLNKLVTDQAFFSVWYQANNAYVSTSNITVTPVTGQMYPTLNHIAFK